MAVLETTGHRLNIGDKVRMNIEKIGKGSLDGVAFTTSGKDYWRYMNEHPDEVYTITDIDAGGDDTIYILSGYMGDNSWYADELIHVPEPATMFEVIKNMTQEEAPAIILSMIHDLCREGLPTQVTISGWLASGPKRG